MVANFYLFIALLAIPVGCCAAYSGNAARDIVNADWLAPAAKFEFIARWGNR